MTQKDYALIFEKIQMLTSRTPGWANKAAERMNLKSGTVRLIAKGVKGHTTDRYLELLEILIDLDNERQERIKRLIA